MNTKKNNKQLLHEVFVISGIIEVRVISRSQRLIHCFEENNDKRILTSLSAILTLLSVHLTLLLEIMHCARNLQIINLSEDRQVGRNIGGLYNVSYLHLRLIYIYIYGRKKQMGDHETDL